MKKLTSSQYNRTSARFSGRIWHNTALGKLEVVIFLFGCVLNALVYETVAPVILAMIYLVFGMGLLKVTASTSFYEKKIYFRTFAVGWFMAGIAAFYADILGDLSQIELDAGEFYIWASQKSEGMSLEDISRLTEGAGAIVLWREVYDAFTVIGFEKGRYVGVLVNVLAVAFTGVIAVKMARHIYGDHPARLQRLCLLFACCGMFWLFAGVHIRDGVVLFAVSALSHAWVLYLSKPGVGLRLFYFLLINLASIVGFTFLRADFALVPICMAICGAAAIMFNQTKRRDIETLVIFVLASGVLVGVWIVFNDQLLDLLVKGNIGYSEFSKDRSSEGSLGASLIVNQTIPFRLVFGSMYLFVFPVPFWSGFQLELVFNLFKSFNVIFFYFFTPLLVLSVWKLWMTRSPRTSSVLFLFFCTLGFTLAIAASSLETRHFGAFFTPMFVLALLPELRIPRERKLYGKLLFLYLSAIFILHALWATLKFS